MTIEEGTSITLNCSAMAEPSPLITWRYNMDYIGQSSSSKITFCTSTCDNCPQNLALGSMTIRDVSPGDEGLYTCEASNPMKSVLAQSDTLVLVTAKRNHLN